MKRLLMTVCCFILLLSFACSPALSKVADGSETELKTTVPSNSPTPRTTPEPTVEPTPDALVMAPVDLTLKEYNPFFDVQFPTGYTIYGARFDSADANKGTKDYYGLYLTAEGIPSEIVKYCATLLGATDETILTGFVQSIENEGFVEISGTFDGNSARAQLKCTVAGYDYEQCTDVDGCRVELMVDANEDQAKLYHNLILANYSLAMLGDLADQLGPETIRSDMLCIFVNTQKPDKTAVYVTHDVKDAATLLNEITTTLQTSWYDEASASLGIAYAMQQVKYSFDIANNLVYATFSPNDNNTSAGDFQKSAVSFISLGFDSYPNDGLCIYKEDQNQLEIAIAKPNWGHNEEWNVEFLGTSNGCFLGMWYTEATGLFHISVNKGDEGATAEYIVAENKFASDVYPDEETQQRLFSEAAGVSEGDYRAAVFAIFEQMVMQRFGMTWQELYALPIW